MVIVEGGGGRDKSRASQSLLQQPSICIITAAPWRVVFSPVCFPTQTYSEFNSPPLQTKVIIHVCFSLILCLKEVTNKVRRQIRTSHMIYLRSLQGVTLIISYDFQNIQVIVTQSMCIISVLAVVYNQLVFAKPCKNKCDVLTLHVYGPGFYSQHHQNPPPNGIINNSFIREAVFTIHDTFKKWHLTNKEACDQ